MTEEQYRTEVSKTASRLEIMNSLESISWYLDGITSQAVLDRIADKVHNIEDIVRIITAPEEKHEHEYTNEETNYGEW